MCLISKVDHWCCRGVPLLHGQSEKYSFLHSSLLGMHLLALLWYLIIYNMSMKQCYNNCFYLGVILCCSSIYGVVAGLSGAFLIRDDLTNLILLGLLGFQYLIFLVIFILDRFTVRLIKPEVRHVAFLLFMLMLFMFMLLLLLLLLLLLFFFFFLLY